MKYSETPLFVRSKIDQASKMDGAAVQALLLRMYGHGMEISSYSDVLLHGRDPGTLMQQMILDNYSQMSVTFRSGMLNALSLCLMQIGRHPNPATQSLAEHYQKLAKPLINHYIAGIVSMITGVDVSRELETYPLLKQWYGELHDAVFGSTIEHLGGGDHINFVYFLFKTLDGITIDNYRKQSNRVEHDVRRLVNFIEGRATILYYQWSKFVATPKPDEAR